MKYILYGMALQAFITSAMTYLGAINPVPVQQALAGSIFLLLSIVFGLTKRAADKGRT